MKWLAEPKLAEARPAFALRASAWQPSPLRERRLVETRGTAPRAAILQGSPAPLCCPRASSWFRATLSAASAQRFHQISLRGELARAPGIEPGPQEWRSCALP